MTPLPDDLERIASALADHVQYLEDISGAISSQYLATADDLGEVLAATTELIRAGSRLRTVAARMRRQAAPKGGA